MQTIRTKWHRILPLIDADEVYLTAADAGSAPPWSKLAPDKAGFRSLIQAAGELPHFVIDRELIELATDTEYQKSLYDMKRGGVLKMPYPSMVVEFPGRTAGQQVITILNDGPPPPGYPSPESHDQFLTKDFYGMRMSVDRDDGGEYLVVGPSVLYIEIEQRDEEPWIGMAALPNGLFPKSNDLNQHVSKTYHRDVGGVLFAATAAYLLMRTAGVEREVVETDKINRKRVTAGKPPVPRHTYVKIGRVYRSAASERSDEYVPRRSPRPHWRRGHLRTVHHGPGRSQTKEVFIYPKLVAYHADAEAPRPDYVVKR